MTSSTRPPNKSSPQIPVGSAADAAAAVNSARLAHPGWARLDLPDRLDHPSRIADNVERYVRELAELENEEMGKPIPLAEQFIAGGIAALRHSIERARSYPFIADVTAPGESGRTIVVREPHLGLEETLIRLVPWRLCWHCDHEPAVSASRARRKAARVSAE
ncbi:aldehyde dehydrogenase family protein [Streptomyces sp. NRRL F-5135]|uniref:aldehyde dehydrogenase family protein n=1 Tax=Streptomyces sp. NRRL F-5135 TaxID=1463858 RepID=UPI0004C6B4E4|nr:aldehyde dehydrogenase family protein [Streptomyces sp. NRRL F-5135]